MGDLVLIKDSNRVRLLTLNRPEALNACNDDVYDALTAALREAAADPDLAVVVLTGQGRAFCAGQDLAELGTPRVHEDGQRHGFPPFIELVEAFPKPLIAAVNGIGIGIGLTILPHCDLVLMADDARLRAPFVTLGVTAEAGSSFLLPAMIGWGNAAHLLYTASWIDAAKAVEIGLAWKAVPNGQLMDEAMALAREIAQMPIASLVTTKQILLAGRLDAVRQARQRENDAFARLVGAPANREAIAAFQEKRPADFTNLPAA
ncbi:MAG: enoyl-CoA hydratase/isomerase family protein [Alphaproteobacteria bacterium]|nr:enoyl-CoA hydratase/isomerase family protein [Alphaproteobacteria bacterium]MBL6952656.1 enoyl-CoA hydratase/isomerase family protein [Alphaproteobacteria bacterium]